MDPFYIAQLVSKRFREGLTEEEALLLQTWSEEDPRNAALLLELEDSLREGIDTSVLQEFNENKAWKALANRRRVRKYWYWGRIAALLAVVGTLSFWFLKFNTSELESRYVISKDVRYDNDVLPAIKGAKIVLADGRELRVDDNVQLLTDGSIATAETKISNNVEEISFNKLIVPAAHFLNLTLSDGTKVWVNANSELIFPNRFASNSRQVKLKGEAYFQVAKDLAKPFTVETEGGNVEVLGTQFNVSAYDNKPITTLEEGKVLIYKGELKETLTPGMKGEIMDSRIDLRKANLQKELAWKNNVFYFKGDNIVTIAKQLKSWYDLEISFSPEVSRSQTYSGEISRSSNLTEVLNMLEFVSDLKFKINNNKLLILKNDKL